MSMLTVFHLGGRWLALDDSRLVELPEYPELDMPVMVVSDFNQALTGVMSLEAKPAMAAPLIERRLRDEGMVEGETRLEISHLVRVGKGFQALYSAIPMLDWQNMISWAGSRSDHCLVVPLLSVAKRLLKPDQAVVLRHGQQVTFLTIDTHSIQHAETMAYSNDSAGVRDAVNSLADRVRALLGQGQRPTRVLWYALDSQPTQDEEALAASFAQAGDMNVQLADHRSLILDSGDTIQSAMPGVAAAAQVSDATTSRFAGLMMLAERALPMAAVLMLVVALGLLLLGWRGHSQAAEKNDSAQQMQAQASSLQSKTRAQMARLKQGSEPLQHTRQFVQRLANASRGQDISVALVKIRQAARTWVRVLRVRTGDTDHRLYVEGAIDEGQQGARNLALFIANLRAAGYDPIAVNPPMGTRSANYFAYALEPAASPATENAP
ncbi:MAG: hypothetical protein WCD66_03060 [Rhodanobacteraceae bacterium]